MTFGIALMSAVLAIGLSSLSIAVADEEKKGEEAEGQEFLFMMDAVYTQEKGKREVSFTTQYMDNKKSREVEYEDGEREDKLKIKDEWLWILGLEYGIFDWLTAEVEIPFANVDKKTIKDEEDSTTVTYLDKTGIGDVEAGLKARLLEEKQDSWIPAASLRLGVLFPTGNWKKDLGSDSYGFELGLALSKTFKKCAYHLNVSEGYTDNTREQGETEKLDEVETECGIALVYMPSKNLDLICEVFAEFERENTAGEYNYETEVYLTPGVKYKFEKFLGGLEVGVGVPVGLTYESYDWGIIVKAMKEF